MGKTRALERIADAYGNRAPRVLIDLEGPRYSDAKTGRGQALISIFSDLMRELEQLVRLTRVRLRFPRLSVALLAITIWPENEPDLTREEAVNRLRAVRAQAERMGPAHKSWVNDWIRDVGLDLSDKISSFPAKVFVKACIRAFAAVTLSKPNRNAPITWHEQFDPRAPGDGYEALNNVSRDFHVGGSYRDHAEEVLIAAFLADLNAGYQGWSGLRRAAHPLVMLDNVCAAPAGLRFLQLVLGNQWAAR